MPILKKYLRWMSLLVVLSLLAACAATSNEPPPGFVPQLDSRSAASNYAAPSIAPPPPPMPVAMAPPPMPKPIASYREQAVADTTVPAVTLQRKVHYEGTIKLVATQPAKLIEQAIEWVRRDGGYVELLTGQQVILQIPAARFRPLYDQILGLGDVVNKTLSARDVTEEFLDVDMRLAQAKATRERLLALVQKAQNSNEKLQLLREVERLSGQIELLESQMARLRTLVDYSRLTLNVETRKTFVPVAPKEPQGFDWIATLAKDQTMPGYAGGYALAVPSGMVDVGIAPLWSAASPDGVTLGTQLRQNEPRGSTAFWANAVQLRMRDRFDLIQQNTAGDFTLLRLQSRDEPRFVYWVALATRNDKLYVAQAYFPSLAHERRFEEPVAASLKGGVK